MLASIPCLLLALGAGGLELLDFEPYQAPGWAAPLVPRAAADGSPLSVPVPAELLGEVEATWINIGVRNASSATATGPLALRVEVDGVPIESLQLNSFAAYGEFVHNFANPRTIPAGRHTLVLLSDALDGFEESDESDNDYGAQWIWKPPTLNFGPVVTRPAPADPLAGREHVAGPTFPNCDGVRAFLSSSPVSGYWSAFALMPGDASDVDLDLHLASTGATDGFAEPLVHSSHGVGETEFVILNHNHTSATLYDAGIVAVAGTQDYSIQTVFAGIAQLPTNGSLIDKQIAANSIAALHEVYLHAGVYIFALENQDPDLALEFGLFGPRNAQGLPYFQKSDTTQPSAISTQSGADPRQYFIAEIPVGGQEFYCVAVWKSQPSDLPSVADYRLRIESGVTASPDESPLRALQCDVYPNPFNPRTTVALTIEQAVPVSMTLFDLRGARVSEIRIGELGPGHHEIELDGLDARGAPLASGRYILQVSAGASQLRRPITLLK